MPWTPRQQGPFRLLVVRAWKAYCAAQGAAGEALVGDKGQRDAWYREQLLAAIGVETTTKAHAARDYARAMAHFESFVGDSIYWQMRAGEDHKRRAEYALRQLMREHDIDEAYVAGIARQMFGRALSNLTGTQIVRVTIALRTHLKRQAPVNSAAPSDRPF